MESCFIPRNNHGITDEEEEEDVASSDGETSDSTRASSSDFMDDGSSDDDEEGPLFQMSNLIAQLPFKRGLSKHYQGKSQSFSSLSNVSRLEDLAKPETPYRKKDVSKNYGVLDYSKALSCVKTISKKSSRGAYSSLGPRKNVVLRRTRPAFNSLRPSGDLAGQALLFA